MGSILGFQQIVRIHNNIVLESSAEEAKKSVLAYVIALTFRY